MLFLGQPGTIGYLSHRIFSHTIVLMPFFALIPIFIGFLFMKWKWNTKIFKLYVISCLSYTIHILLDLATPFGVQLFYPFNMRVFSLDLFHTFDPVFIIISISIISYTVIRLTKNKYLNKKSFFIFSSVIAFYILFTCISKFSFEKRFLTYTKNENLVVKHLATTPRTFWRWKAISEDKESSYVFLFENNKSHFIKYNKLNNINLKIKNSNEFYQFMTYARYPAILENSMNTFSLFNLVYTPNTYRLTFSMNQDGSIKNSKMTSFDLSDNHKINNHDKN